MKTDVKNNINIYQYPRIEFNELNRINESDIIRIIGEHQDTFIVKFNDNENFYNGVNQKFYEYTKEAPNNVVNVPYARLLTSTVKGYMYKPGLIRYSSENEEGINKILDIYKINNEPLRNSELGEHQSRYGIGFEIEYLGKKNNFTEEIIPKFKTINPKEIIPIFDYTIEKNLIAAIRYYDMDDSLLQKDEIEKYLVDVYYQNEILTYQIVKSEIQAQGKKEEKVSIVLINEVENIFNEIPIIMYPNNEEYLADYEPVRGLIVEYDKLFSDSANELDRFAAAYMILQNFVLAGNAQEQREKLEELKRNRVFEIDENGSVSFLTKDIPTEFFKTIRDSIIDELHKQTTVPNFQDQTFATASGIAIQFKLTNFENTAADKESHFRVGLEKRISFMKRYLSIKEGQENDFDVIIKFNRNLPSDVIEKVNTISQLKSSGLKITDKTLLSLLPFIENVQSELDEYEKQKEKDNEGMDVGNLDDEIPDDKMPNKEMMNEEIQDKDNINE